ncbi:Hsp20/alpha crystallin family protein [Desulfobotulus sp.]|jgi:HSP20 family protein|uniref:Hsp20/alpha crystallin family protein n=1 Tax=Desulfobotulus sp. TaxID=1940337 RepID=UPI002A367608|nr:Hsp20/alpha crystallin family protein [Desulfobotulus sp.]MDY0163211.1 Hsp20/alpha crystallin family protein [Desulfobotulus sp.]
MTLVRWEPFRNVATLQERINRMFDEAFNKARDLDENAMGAWRPSVDIFENDHAIILEAELPGVTREDIDVEVENNVLTLKGERKEVREVEEERYYRKERIIGRFHRAFTLPVDVNLDQIKASFQNGVLRLEVPKPEEKKPRKIAIAVEG